MFEKRLKSLRKNRDLSQYKLAELLNLTRGQIANYEQGKRQPDFDTLQLFADFFDTTTDYLLGRTDDPTPPQAKKETPSHEEYVLSVKTLGDAAIRIAELLSQDLIDGKEYLRLNELAVKKFPLRPAKGASKAAHLEVNIPGTGVFEDKASEK